jgi:hypothetical protein
LASKSASAFSCCVVSQKDNHCSDGDDGLVESPGQFC